jgi:formylglycine-generating enzyme required for sulfatase activity
MKFLLSLFLLLNSYHLSAALVLMNHSKDITMLHHYEGQIVIKPCKDFSVVTLPTDCELKTGRKVEKFEVSYFEKQIGHTFKDHQSFPELYREDLKNYQMVSKLPGLQSKKSNLQSDFDKIKKFSKRFGPTPDSAKEMAEIESQMNDLDGQIVKLTKAKNRIGFLLSEFMTNLLDESLVILVEKNGTTKRFSHHLMTRFISKDNPLRGLDFVYIQKGSFMMGSPTTETNRDLDESHHRVNLTKDFHMMKTEVTQELYATIMGANPSFHKARTKCSADFKSIKVGTATIAMCPNNPVENVSWAQIKMFIQKLNKKTFENYRLPTEAEWEFAARAGKNTTFYFGNDYSGLATHAWYDKNSTTKTMAVAKKLPNAFGLYDMSGNVWEFVEDLYSKTYDKSNPLSRSDRTIRGGGHKSQGRYTRTANRAYRPAAELNADVGFRLVKD